MHRDRDGAHPCVPDGRRDTRRPGLADTTDAPLDGDARLGDAVERLVVTHTDGDHVDGTDAVVEIHEPELWRPAGGDADAVPRTDRVYGDGDTVSPFEAVQVPGHRDHQHALVADGYALLADALSGADQRGLSGGFHLPPGTFTDDLNEAERSLERLLAYEFEVGLVFHGSNVLEDASATLERYVLPA